MASAFDGMSAAPQPSEEELHSIEEPDAKRPRIRRAYKACLHCKSFKRLLSRKARCDLGDTQNPRDPPCSRCRRELRQCVFVPSKRGGRVKKAEYSPPPMSEDLNNNGMPVHHSPVTPAGQLQQPQGQQQQQQGQHQMADPIVSAKIHNPSDALQLLVLTAEGHQTEGSPQGSSTSNAAHTDHVSPNESNHQYPSPPNNSASSPAASLSTVPMCQNGIVSASQLHHLLLDVFFPKIHPTFPFMPQGTIPTDEAALAVFAINEPHLSLAAVVVASRMEQNSELHDRAWSAFEEQISKLVLGEVPTLGSIEALLLLSEHIPRQKDCSSSEIQRMRQEERVAWNFVGLAIRFGYLLGLDQATFVQTKPTDPKEQQQLERQRVCWTHCYIHDRSITIQLGKAFWSRGPGLCFDIRPMLLPAKEGGHRNFPSLRPRHAEDDDFAALLQSYVEITQILSSAHDILFSTKEQTMTLQRSGAYYTHLDQFRHALNSFRAAWQGHHWSSKTFSDVLWATYHYARQYCYSFAFSAHVFRFADASECDAQTSMPAFPRGVPSIPDSKYIFEAVDAAEQVLSTFCDSLYQQGCLAWLPDRFFSYWAYSGVFLLKAVFVGSVMPDKERHILRLVKSSTFCLASASPDEQHVGVRYARLLNGLIRTFSNTEIHTPRYAPPTADFASNHQASDASPRRTAPQQNLDPANPFSDFLGDHYLPGMLNTFNTGQDIPCSGSGVSNTSLMQFAPVQLDLGPSAVDDPLSAFLNEQALDADFWRGFGQNPQFG